MRWSRWRSPTPASGSSPGRFQPKKTTYAQITFVEAALFAHGPAGFAFRPEAVEDLRSADALLHVVRCFEDPASVHPAGSIDPDRDRAAVETELVLADLVPVERRLERLRKEGKPTAERDLLEKVLEHLGAELPVRELELDAANRKLLSGFGFASAKPLLTVLNLGEDALGEVDSGDAGVIRLSARIEAEIAELGEEEQAEFLADLGLEGSARDRLIREAYRLLGLRSFFTVGEDEVKAWTIRAGTPAQRAAGKIHSDLERGFIRAEVVSYEHFLEDGDLAGCRETGHLRLEGKDYVVEDGDIVNVRFNV